MSQLTICIVIFVITMIGFAIGNKYIPISVISLISMMALVLTGCLDGKTALSCFSNSNVVLLGSMFVVSAGLNRTQMSNKIAAYICKVAKGSFRKVLTGYVLLAFLLMQFIPSPVAVSAVVFPMAVKVCREMNVKPSKMIYSLLIICVGTYGILPFSSAMSEVAFNQGFLDSFYPDASLHVMDFFYGRIILGVVLILFAIFVIPKLSPDKDELEDEDLTASKAAPAPLSPVREVIGYATFLAVLVGFFFSEKLGISNWQITIIGALIIGASGILNKKELVDNLGLGTLFLYIGCLGLCNALSNTGAADLIGDACGSLILGVHNNYVAGFIFFIVPFVLTQFMLNTGIQTIFNSVWIMVCSSMGVDPTAAIVLTLTAAMTAFFTPMATPAVPVAMKYGNYNMKDLAKMGWMPALVITIVAVFSVMTIYPIF